MDRRVQYTKQVLKETFFELLKEKPVSKISVTDLCEKANINRGTFYTHYLDIYDLYDKLCSEILQEIINELEYVGPNKECHEPVYNILEMINKQRDLFFTIIKWEDNDSILERLFILFHDKFITMISNDFKLDNLKYIDYCYQFIIGGSIAVITNWIKNGYKADVKVIGDCLITLSHNGFSQYLNNTKKS